MRGCQVAAIVLAAVLLLCGILYAPGGDEQPRPEFGEVNTNESAHT